MRFTLALLVIALAIMAFVMPQATGRKHGTAIPITRRSRLVNVDQPVDFDVINKHVASVIGKILHGFDNFEKNTGKPHPSAPKGVVKRGVADDLTYDNMDYYGLILVGTPLMLFNVQFDTTSSDIFIPLSTCDSSCNGHATWEVNISTSGIDTGQPFSFDDGNGRSASGELYTDIVAIGDISATAQTIGAVSHYGSAFQSSHFPADGVLGLGFPSISNFGANPLLQTLVSQGQLPEPIFSFKLEHSGGELYIGGSDSSQYTGDFTYVPVETNGFWEMTADSVRGYGQPILTNIDCVMDTSAYLIIGPSSDISTLYAALGGKPAPSSYGQGYYTLPCDSFQTLYFTFGGTPFPVPPSSYNFGVVSSDSSDCVTGIIGQEINFWIMGDVFLRNVYTTYDFANSRVGFAQLA